VAIALRYGDQEPKRQNADGANPLAVDGP
jgi:hypothetical protein